MDNSPMIFMDECGYTGEDLFNPDQRIFSLAALNLTEAEALELQGRFFSKVASSELKHTSLSKYVSRQKMVIDFLKYINSRGNVCKIYVVHKRYALATKVMDVLVEEAIHKVGGDFYKDGLNIAYSNLFFVYLPAIVGWERFDDMLFKFQVLIRERTPKAYSSFIRSLRAMGLKGNSGKTFEILLNIHKIISIDEIRDYSKNCLDVVLTAGLCLMDYWHKQLRQEMILVYDSSSNMTSRADLWQAFVNPDLNPITVGYDIRKMTFPIGVQKTMFEKSHDWAGLQLADIIAGACARWGNGRILEGQEKDQYAVELNSIFPGSLVQCALWPSTDITPQEIGTVGEDEGSLIDYATNIVGEVYRGKMLE